ncbi:hypothetical protein BBJ28_00019543 [Nothophytophthora sp. Chile5]|nr:hypothetical protein BBJ28_00019543 [Nothophytophthora sp. Chile5]
MGFSWSTTLSLAFTISVAVGMLQAQAGHVELYGDSDFKDKIASIKDVIPNACYSLCNELNGVISSARWGGLPEKKEAPSKNVDSRIIFFTGKGCAGGLEKAWPIKTQRVDALHFPSLFTLDGMNDAISSFFVLTGGKGRGIVEYCNTESSTLDIANSTNGTTTGSHGEGGIAARNDTVGYL